MVLSILVTGSSGFIGSALTSALAEAGHRVRAASRKPDKVASPGLIEWVGLPDLATEVDWDPLIAGMDVVIHLAAIADQTHIDNDLCARVNCAATASLAKACQRQKTRRLIFMSSIAAQAGSAADHVVTETDQPLPVTPYGRAKLAAEQEIRNSGVPFTILRPVIVYGPGVKSNIALIKRIAALPLPLPFGAMTNRRSLLAIDNLLQAIMVCLASPETLNQTFIVCDPEPITLAEMFVAFREADGRSARLVAIPPLAIKAIITALGKKTLWDRIGRDLVASSAKLQKAGWFPQTSTKAGLRAMAKTAGSVGA
jgi:nucleoside-diphosphate-sugar epimerase